jgi:hypothetical protein
MEAGPRREPGTQRANQSVTDLRAEMEERPKAEQVRTPREVVLELSANQITALNLILTRKQLAEAEMKLAILRLKEAQADIVRTVKDEAVALARIAAANNLPKISNVKAIGPSKISCEIP